MLLQSAGVGGFSFTSGYSTPNPGSLLQVLSWSRGPRARAAGGTLHTGAILKALSAGGVSGFLPIGGLPSSYGRGASSSLESSALLRKLEVVPKIPKIDKTRLSPVDALKAREIID